MGEEVGIGAARFFEGVAEDRQVRETPFLIDGLGECEDRGRLPGYFEGGPRAKRVAEDAAQQLTEAPILPSQAQG
jgi:hypothetical protein